MNHAFLFQVHKEPELIDRILTRLEAKNHYFIINVDNKSDFSEFERVLSKHQNIVDITRQNVMHGGFSQVACTIYQMKRLMESGLMIDYYHTLSGQDYPCVSNEVFDEWFDVNFGKSYSMMDSPEQAREWRKEKYRLRLERWNWADVFNSKFSKKLHLNGIASRITSFIKHPYPELESIWGGWNWFSLYSDAVRFLLEYINENPEYLKRFHFTSCCDELVFSTILYYKRIELEIETRNSLRYVEWHPKRKCDSYPLILNDQEYEDIVNSGAFFCRKVEMEYSKILLEMIDKRADSMEIKLPLQNPKTP